MTMARADASGVNEWVAKLAPPQQALAEAIRTLVKEAVPGAQEEIKWRQVCFVEHGNFAYMNTAKAYMTLGFFRGTELDDPAKLLEGSGNTMRHIKVRDAASIPVKQLKAWLRAAAKINKQGR